MIGCYGPVRPLQQAKCECVAESQPTAAACAAEHGLQAQASTALHRRGRSVYLRTEWMFGAGHDDCGVSDRAPEQHKER